MTSVASSGGVSDAQDGAYDSSRLAVKEPGTRRKRLAGYIQAAKELRQTYQQQYAQSWSNDRSLQDEGHNPADFPDAAVVKGDGGEEMVIFPSYARRHVKTSPHAQSGTIQEVTGAGREMGLGWDADYWKQQWDKYENDKAIVDVDVRGWLYTPHSGPLNRKHRLFIGLARQMVGIAAPPGKSPSNSNPNSRSASPHGVRERYEAHSAKREDEIVAREAELIMKKGHVEAEIAGEGKYSERPHVHSSHESDGLSLYGTSIDMSHNRDLSPGSETASRRSSQQTQADDDDPSPGKLQHVKSWNNPSQMSPAELSLANSHLMNRLGPFLANPSANIPVSAVFYDDEKAHSKTVHTNPSGQFSFRAALDFVPTHVRVLAVDGLSITEEVRITEPHGVSVISDIDDTIKHSAVNSGAREIFRNVFVRDLEDLTIEGVKDWYNRMADMGVYFHYVSNSPWQLFPLLTSFFAKARLPAGSFHLKQYNGMLQGIFEPVAERKRSSLDKILHDFPERRFILVGDSGEADLEVYTEVVLEYPGRILGIFIRDITTSKKKGFFDSAIGPSHDFGEKSSMSSESAVPSNSGLQTPKPGKKAEDAELDAAIAASLQEYDLKAQTHGSAPTSTEDNSELRPALPRRPTDPVASEHQKSSAESRDQENIEEDLIDLNGGSDRPFPLQRANTDFPIQRTASPKPLTPPPIQSPSQDATSSDLRSETFEDGTTHISSAIQTATEDPIVKSPVKILPPRPRKPSTAVNPNAYAHLKGPTSAPMQHEDASAPPKPPRPALSLLKSNYEKPPPPSRRGALARSATEDDKPPLPMRKPLTAVAASYASSLYASAASATSAYASSWTEGEGHAGSPMPGPKNGTTAALLENVSVTAISKREELWRRRWARAKHVLEGKGVVLKTWRVGEDAEGEAIRLVERALREDEEGKGSLQGEQGGHRK